MPSNLIIDSTMPLDGAAIHDTQFSNCILTYSGGAFPDLTGCSFVNCRFVLEGAARNTQIFLATLARSGADSLVREMVGLLDEAKAND